jgi:hypothetical protein
VLSARKAVAGIGEDQRFASTAADDDDQQIVRMERRCQMGVELLTAQQRDTRTAEQKLHHALGCRVWFVEHAHAVHKRGDYLRDIAARLSAISSRRMKSYYSCFIRLLFRRGDSGKDSSIVTAQASGGP